LVSGGRGVYVVLFGSVAEGRCGPLSGVDIAVRGLDLREAPEAGWGRGGRYWEEGGGCPPRACGAPPTLRGPRRGISVAGDREAYILDWRLAIVGWLDFKDSY